MFLKHSLMSAASAVRTWSVVSCVKHGGVVVQLGHCSSRGQQRCGYFTWMASGSAKRNETCTSRPVRQYARAAQKKSEFQSQLQDLPASMLKLEYASVPLAHTVDGVVKKLLSLELASHSERLRLKEKELIAKVQRHENDRNSTEVKVAILTARIRNFQEHLQKHSKDKANKRWMLMSIDRRKKLLKYLRRSRYDAFEKVCAELGITYTFPPEYYRRATRRWLAKKALCIRVFKEVQKKKVEKRNKALAQNKPRITTSNATESQGTPV
ncbi:small ribosomal subunit protein uS15m [Tachysurus vachellii]|uniref:small ribosomal subunit protein uS15m n=1 Tax=Tachysurus vachellii TaxID=175792 RepID=UPI00296AF936|nr:small ribosomal subunit protein uS15m [Tachysurus vachellii]